MYDLRVPFLVAAVFLSPQAWVGGDATVPSSALDPATMEALWEAMAPATEEDLAVLGEWKSVVLGYVPAEAILRPTFEQIRLLLDDSVEKGLSAAHFFSDAAWRDEHRAVLLGPSVLAQVDEAYRLHALFLPCTTDVEKKPVAMTWLVLGNSQLLIGYDRACTVHLPDYDFGTGKYGYNRFLRIRIGQDGEGHPGFLEIKGADRPKDTLKWFSGPLDVALKSVVVVKERLRCSYTEFLIPGTKWVRLLPIERLPLKGPADGR